jgi:hypothetical protein
MQIILITQIFGRQVARLFRRKVRLRRLLNDDQYFVAGGACEGDFADIAKAKEIRPRERQFYWEPSDPGFEYLIVDSTIDCNRPIVTAEISP